jgi:hypothetical protein
MNYHKNPQMREYIGWEFEKFVRAVCGLHVREMNHHFSYQKQAIAYCGQVRSELFHVETIEEDWKGLQERFGLPDLKRTRTSNHRPWREYYDDELIALVERKYAVDYELGGYERVSA